MTHTVLMKLQDRSLLQFLPGTRPANLSLSLAVTGLRQLGSGWLCLYDAGPGRRACCGPSRSPISPAPPPDPRRRSSATRTPAPATLPTPIRVSTPPVPPAGCLAAGDTPLPGGWAVDAPWSPVGFARRYGAMPLRCPCSGTWKRCCPPYGCCSPTVDSTPLVRLAAGACACAACARRCSSA